MYWLAGGVLLVVGLAAWAYAPLWRLNRLDREASELQRLIRESERRQQEFDSLLADLLAKTKKRRSLN